MQQRPSTHLAVPPTPESPVHPSIEAEFRKDAADLLMRALLRSKNGAKTIGLWMQATRARVASTSLRKSLSTWRVKFVT